MATEEQEQGNSTALTWLTQAWLIRAVWGTETALRQRGGRGCFHSPQQRGKCLLDLPKLKEEEL